MRRFNVSVNGVGYDVVIDETASSSAPVATAPAPAAVPAPIANGGVEVKSPMPGNIMKIDVAVGDTVTAGTVLLVLEAMKMENDIVAPQDGKIASILVKQGDTVNSDDLLVTLA